LSGMILTIRADSYQALFPAPRPQPSPAPSPAPSTATLDERIKAAQAEVAALTAALARGDQALSEAGLPSPRPNTGTLALPYAYPYPLATASPSLGAPYALPTFPRGDLSPASLLGSLNLLAPSSTWAAYLGSASAMPSVLARPLVPRSALPPPYPTPVAAAAHAASLSSLRPAFSLALLGPWPSRSRST
jgi:hypothetical protein